MNWTIAPVLVMLLVAGPAVEVRANEWVAPDTVMAGATGWYEYECVLTVTEDSAWVAAVMYTGLVNAEGTMNGDCFCIPQTCVRYRGEQWILGVAGQLVDPGLPGLATCSLSLCPWGGYASDTVIIPWDPTPVVPFTWGRLRILFGPGD